MALTIGLTATARNSLETNAADETYTYVTGGGTWVTENEVRTYSTTNFTMTHRKNTSTSNIAITYAELRVYANHSMEIIPTVAGSRYLTSIEVTASTAAYATAMGNATILAGANEAGATTRTGLSSVSGSVATFNLAGVSNCGFVKFSLAAQARTTAWKIAYSLAGGETVAVTGVSVSPESHSMPVGGTHTPVATISPANATNQVVSWASDDGDIASVDAVTGLVTGLSVGSTRIVATTDDGSFTDYVDYEITTGPIYTHQLATGELGATGANIDGTSVTLSSFVWGLTASWYPDITQTYYMGFASNRGLQVGSGDKGAYSFGMRSVIPAYQVTSLSIKCGGASSIVDGTISVKVGGVSLGEPQTLSTSTATPYFDFTSATPLFGHIQIAFSQLNDGTAAGSKAFYIDALKIYGSSTADVTAATTFASSLEAFDCCGDGATFSTLYDSYMGLSATAQGYLSSINLDDHNGVGQAAGATIQRDIVTAAAKWAYADLLFGGSVGALNNGLFGTDAIYSIVFLGIAGITIIGGTFFLKRKQAE